MIRQTTLLIQAGLIFSLTMIGAVAKDLPYKGKAFGEVVGQEFICEPVVGGDPFLSERAEATGKFTQVGEAKIELEWIVSLKAEARGLVFVLVGQFTMTAADGSAITGSFCSLQDYDSAENEIEVIVTQGTGRFKGISGIIPGKGVRNDNSFSYSLDGLIWTSRGK